MSKVFVDNYCYEISGTQFFVHKYDIFSNHYYKIDEYSMARLPTKYTTIVKDMLSSTLDIPSVSVPMTSSFTDIKVSH